MERKQIRQQLRQLRRQQTPHQAQVRSEAICRHLMSSAAFRNSRRIALFLSNDGEVDLQPLLARALAMGKQCFLPVLHPSGHNRLWFMRYDEATPLYQNRYGIDEPPTLWRSRCEPWALDMILMPLVAFDEQGNRLGMGKGYYDRTLAYLARRKNWRKPRLYGVAYDFQRMDTLPHESWDVPMEAAVTERGVFCFT